MGGWVGGWGGAHRRGFREDPEGAEKVTDGGQGRMHSRILDMPASL